MSVGHNRTTHNYNGINLLDKALIEYLIDKWRKKEQQPDKR